jgi:uncharacterized protein YmfQ (DUF2313 family)
VAFSFPKPATAAHYADLVFRLLPPSIVGLFSRASETLENLAHAIGAELARVDNRTDDAVEEGYPNTADETIEAWERVLGITDPPAALSDRQALVWARFRAQGGQWAAYYRIVCESFGYTSAQITIVEPYPFGDPFRVDTSRVGEPIGGGGGYPHTWEIQYPLPQNTDLEAEIEKIKPAHTFLIFTTF